MTMGPEDDSESKLYYTVNGMTGMVWSDLRSFTLETLDEPEAADHYCDHLPFLEGTLSFTLKDPYISRKLLRPVRRWSRKKAQQKKRKLAKEKKDGLLHKET